MRIAIPLGDPPPSPLRSPTACLRLFEVVILEHCLDSNNAQTMAEEAPLVPSVDNSVLTNYDGIEDEMYDQEGDW
mgnify:CR=1 FL=1